MTMFLTVIVSLYVFSHAYNVLLVMWYSDCEYRINSAMGVTNARLVVHIYFDTKIMLSKLIKLNILETPLHNN